MIQVDIRPLFNIFSNTLDTKTKKKLILIILVVCKRAENVSSTKKDLNFRQNTLKQN